LSQVAAVLVPGAGPRIVTSEQVVADALPEALSLPVIDAVRDQLVVALAALLQEYERRSDVAAAQCDPARAVRQCLLALGGDRLTFRSEGEEEEAFRERVLAPPACVTEPAIAAGINVILSLYTDTECQLVDAVLDQWFINDGTDGNGGPAKWHSFIGAGPSYPDRYFADDALNNDGLSRPNSAVGGARLFDDTLGRHLLILVPDLGYQQRDAAFVWDGSPEGLAQAQYSEGGFFVGDGSDEPQGAFIDATNADPLAVYRAIYNFVNLTLGQSIRWTMLSDLKA
jgi:hypothetical protein